MSTESTTQTNRSASPQKLEITPELVREVADKVYAQMRRELKLGRERYPRSVSSYTNVRRGW